MANNPKKVKTVAATSMVRAGTIEELKQKEL